MKRYILVSFLLRVGIAFSFLYAAAQSFLNPSNWVGFFPVWMQSFAEQSIGLENMLVAFSVFDMNIKGSMETTPARLVMEGGRRGSEKSFSFGRKKLTCSF